MKTISQQLQRITQGALFGLLCVAVSPANAQINTLPGNDPLGGRMINVTRGLSSLGEIGTDTFSVSIEVPCESSPCNAATQSHLVIQIFDGNIADEWDVVPAGGADAMEWRIYPDPGTIGNGVGAPFVGPRLASTFPDNAFDYLVNGPHDPNAICDSVATCGVGKPIRNAFVYHLDLRWVTPTKTNEQNNFMGNVCMKDKVTSVINCGDPNAGKAFLLPGSTIGFIGYGPIDPRFPTTNDTTYNGTFTFFAQVKNIPGEFTCKLDIYTGDVDRADDTDDTNNSPLIADIPFPHAPAPPLVEQGVNPGIPADDAGASNPLRHSPSVYYQVQGPAGSYIVTDNNPSGDKEWELFRIASTHPDCTALVGGLPNDKDYTGGNPANGVPDVLVPQILDGDHKISFIGLDSRNTVFMTVSEEVTGAPTIECQECEGKVTQLTLRYDGPPLPGNISVIQGKVDGAIDGGDGKSGKGKGKGKGGSEGDGTVLFDGPVAPGEVFTFVGANLDGTMGTRIAVCVDVDVCIEIHTSCSQPIGPGTVFTDGTHTLTVDTAFSRIGGEICPAGPSGQTCKDNKPLHSLTMIWNGTEEVSIQAWDGAVGGTPLGAPQTNITPGTEVTVSGYSDSSPNDVFWEIFRQSDTSKVGNSTFHLSCSDPGMDGPEDCGQPEGNGKDAKPVEPNLVNDWLLEGYSNLAGPGLVCTP